MLAFLQSAVDPNFSNEHSLLLVSVGEQLGKDNQIRIGSSGLLNHELGNVTLSTVEVVHPESLEVFGHGADVLRHVSPTVRRVLGLSSVSDSDQVSPDVHSSSQVVELLRVDKID